MPTKSTRNLSRHYRNRFDNKSKIDQLDIVKNLKINSRILKRQINPPKTFPESLYKKRENVLFDLVSFNTLPDGKTRQIESSENTGGNNEVSSPVTVGNMTDPNNISDPNNMSNNETNSTNKILIESTVSGESEEFPSFTSADVIYTNPICRNTDALIFSTIEVEDLLSLLISHRGVFYPQNLISILEHIIDIVETGRSWSLFHSPKYLIDGSNYSNIPMSIIYDFILKDDRFSLLLSDLSNNIHLFDLRSIWVMSNFLYRVNLPRSDLFVKIMMRLTEVLRENVFLDFYKILSIMDRINWSGLSGSHHSDSLILYKLIQNLVFSHYEKHGDISIENICEILNVFTKLPDAYYMGEVFSLCTSLIIKADLNKNNVYKIMTVSSQYAAFLSDDQIMAPLFNTLSEWIDSNFFKDGVTSLSDAMILLRIYRNLASFNYYPIITPNLIPNLIYYKIYPSVCRGIALNDYKLIGSLKISNLVEIIETVSHLQSFIFSIDNKDTILVSIKYIISYLNEKAQYISEIDAISLSLSIFGLDGLITGNLKSQELMKKLIMKINNGSHWMDHTIAYGWTIVAHDLYGYMSEKGDLFENSLNVKKYSLSDWVISMGGLYCPRWSNYGIKMSIVWNLLFVRYRDSYIKCLEGSIASPESIEMKNRNPNVSFDNFSYSKSIRNIDKWNKRLSCQFDTPSINQFKDDNESNYTLNLYTNKYEKKSGDMINILYNYRVPHSPLYLDFAIPSLRLGVILRSSDFIKLNSNKLPTPTGRTIVELNMLSHLGWKVVGIDVSEFENIESEDKALNMYVSIWHNVIERFSLFCNEIKFE